MSNLLDNVTFCDMCGYIPGLCPCEDELLGASETTELDLVALYGEVTSNY